MHLGPKIWKRLNKYSDKLTGKFTISQFKENLEFIIKPFGAKVIIELRSLSKNKLFAIGGEYDFSTNRQPITIFLFINQNKQQIYLSKKRKESFLFQLNQTLQHELIHKFQHAKKQEKFYTTQYNFSKGSAKRGLSSMEYLAIVEEIDAYSHDLAMEIIYYYPEDNYKTILNNLSKYKKLYTWNLYSTTFKGARWNHIKAVLLLKTYKWLPLIKEKFL